MLQGLPLYERKCRRSRGGRSIYLLSERGASYALASVQQLEQVCCTHAPFDKFGVSPKVGPRPKTVHSGIKTEKQFKNWMPLMQIGTRPA